MHALMHPSIENMKDASSCAPIFSVVVYPSPMWNLNGNNTLLCLGWQLLFIASAIHNFSNFLWSVFSLPSFVPCMCFVHINLFINNIEVYTISGQNPIAKTLLEYILSRIWVSGINACILEKLWIATVTPNGAAYYSHFWVSHWRGIHHTRKIGARLPLSDSGWTDASTHAFGHVMCILYEVVHLCDFTD